MGKIKNALMDWNLENGWDICATGHNKRPRMIMIKNAYLRANTNGAAGSYDWLDFVSNGIKIRNTSSGANSNNETYLVFAWAEEPLVANVGQSIPATAR